MEADIDFDVICHLGYIRNIDVSSRGVYFVRLSLLYGDDEQRVAPIGLFSAPSRLDSFVAEQRVPPPPFLNVCHIDNEDQTFRCRSFVIRYRDEKHELNDGVHWRLTIPQVDLMSWRGGTDLLSNGDNDNKSSNSYPVSHIPGLPGGLLFEDTLQIHCELFHAPLLDALPGTNMLFDIAAVIPRIPVFEVVSSQKITIQNYGWAGFHEYYPIRFDRSHCVDLDMMVHCGITDIKYNKMSFGVLPSAERSIHYKLSGQVSNGRGTDQNSTPSPIFPHHQSSVGSASVQDMSGKLNKSADESGDRDEGEYPAGIGIWYTKSNVATTELTPNTSAQPLRSTDIKEDHFSPPVDVESHRTPEKVSPPFITASFGTPTQPSDDTVQYFDDVEDDQVSPLSSARRASFQPPRKSFTPGPYSVKKHKKTSSMPALSNRYAEEDQPSQDEEVVLADDFYSPTSSPEGNQLPLKTPASRKSYKPARKSFTPGPSSVSARTVQADDKDQSHLANISSMFYNSKNSPIRLSSDPALQRDLVNEDSIPIHEFHEDTVTSLLSFPISQQAEAARTGYSYDELFDAAMVEESLRDVSINIEFPQKSVKGTTLINKQQPASPPRSSDAGIFAIQVPIIHTESPSSGQSHELGTGYDSRRSNVVPIVLRHQITTVVKRRISDRFSDTGSTAPTPRRPGSSNSRQNTPSVAKEDMTPQTTSLNEAMIETGNSTYNSASPKRKTSTREESGRDEVVSFGNAFDSDVNYRGSSPYTAGASGRLNAGRKITACGVELEDALALLCSYFGPIIANQNKLLAGMEWILKLLSKQNTHAAGWRAMKEESISVLTPELSAHIMNADSISSLKDLLLQHANSSSLDKCAGIWKQLFVALPKVMPAILSILKKRYMKIIHGFWKEQLMVHTCRDTNMTKVHPAEASAAQLLEAMLKIESEHGFIAAGYSVAQIDLATAATPAPNTHDESSAFTEKNIADLLSPPLAIDLFYQPLGKARKPTYRGYFGESDIGSSVVNNSPHFYLPARGMRLYDSAVYKVASRLPTLVVQQYISNRKLNETTPPKLSIYKPKEGIQRGGALIGVEPTALAMAIKFQQSSEYDKQRSADTAQINSVKMSLQSEFGGETESSATITSISQNTMSSNSIKRTSSQAILASTSSKPNSDGSTLPYNADSIYDEEGEDTASAKFKGPHIIFLQHGFKGCAYDMRLLRNAITAMFPDNTQVYAAEANEKESEESIELMGQRLAIEVHQYIKSREPKMLKDPLRGRVSFIGHSVGGLIIRKALESEILKPLLCKLHLYMSLASPHLGTLYADSQLVSTGMWALFKLQKAAVLRELALDDVRRDDMTKSLLYRLSENGMFMYFKWVVFASSPKDQYVPQYSARVQVSSKAVADARTGPAIVEMAANVMAQTDPSRLFRISIDNNTGLGANINNMIGRTAHICYLDNPIVVDQNCEWYPK